MNTPQFKENSPIIESLLDTDFYKFTMLQFIWKHYGEGQEGPEVVSAPIVRAGLIDRDPSKNVSQRVRIEDLQKELKAIEGLRFTGDELEYLQSLGHFSPEFLRWLAQLRLPPVELSQDSSGYKIEVVGEWAEIMLWETFVMSVISELFFRALVHEQGLESDPYSEGERILNASIAAMQGEPDFRVSDFITRRRASKAWHRHVTERLSRAVNSDDQKQLLGTSNVLLAKELNLTPVGTMAHELYMVGSGIHRERDDQEGWLWSQEYINQQWWDFYGEAFSLWLTDTFGTESFLAAFSPEIAVNSRGFREDSSEPPISYAYQIQEYFDSLEMPREEQRKKTVLSSNSLEVPAAVELFQQVRQMFTSRFGIGGGLGNRLGDNFVSPNIVFKPKEVNGQPVVKLSDSPGKVSGDPAEVQRVRQLAKQTIARQKSAQAQEQLLVAR